MSPSFSLEERLLFALAPPSVRALFRRRGEASFREALDGRGAGPPNGTGRPARVAAAWAAHRARTDPRTVIAACEREGISLLFPDDPRWPERFAHLGASAPGILFLRGTVPAAPWIAVIGTRQPTAYGERATDALVHGLADAPVGILSGFALGTDGRAHARAVAAGLPTLAILGTGLDERTLGPRRHHGLAREILSAGGGLLSETAPGAPVVPGCFPARNRLIAALCHALVVIEARERSGTLITARIALELGRDVLAVPGSLFSDASIGTNRLIAAGARPCLGAGDVWTALALDAPADARRSREALPVAAEDRALLGLLAEAAEGMSVDTLADTLGRPAEALIARLGLLELQGLARQTAAGNWLGTSGP